MAIRRTLTPDEIDTEIRTMHSAGRMPSDISRRLGIPTALIRERIAALELPQSNEGGSDRQSAIWSAESDDVRRRLIWERQRRAAAEQRAALNAELAVAPPRRGQSVAGRP